MNKQLFKTTNRLIWTPCLHEIFLECVEEVGGAQKATPKKIKELMVKQNINYCAITLDQLKSYLQSHRNFLNQLNLDLISKDLTGEVTPLGEDKIRKNYFYKRKLYENSPTFQTSKDNLGSQLNLSISTSEMILNSATKKSRRRRQKTWPQDTSWPMNTSHLENIGVTPPVLVSEPNLEPNSPKEQFNSQKTFLKLSEKSKNYIEKQLNIDTSINLILSEETINRPTLDNLWCNESLDI